MKYPCGACNKEVTKSKKSLACNLCEFWFHYDCIAWMTEDIYAICAKAYDLHQYSAFFCKPCQKATSKLQKGMDELKKENTRLKEKVDSLEKLIEKVDARMSKMENKAEKVKESLDEVVENVASGLEKAKE